MSEDPAASTVADLGSAAREAVARLGASTDPAAFQQLLSLSEAVGAALGESARTLAQAHSWSRVAESAGTSRQAAWSRWSR